MNNMLGDGHKSVSKSSSSSMLGSELTPQLWQQPVQRSGVQSMTSMAPPEASGKVTPSKLCGPAAHFSLGHIQLPLPTRF